MYCSSPNISNWSACCSEAEVGPTGATGATGPAGPAFTNQGFNVSLAFQTPIINTVTLVAFDTVNTSRGEFNDGGMYNLIGSSGNISQAGTYIVTTTVNYIHNGFAGSETAIVTIYRNGLGGQPLIANELFYTGNDSESIVCANVVKLQAGDFIQVYITVPLSSAQAIGPLSKFSCQRIA